MQLIIDGGDQASREERVHTLFPTSTTSYLTIEKEKTSIKVASIRELLTSLATSTNITRLVWIPDSDTLTIASQNTLLKILEEPPTNTNFALTLSNKRVLLPTILSRCTHIHLEGTIKTIDHEILKTIKSLMSQGYATRLTASTKLGKDREEVATWFLTLLGSLHATLQNTTNLKGQQVLATIANQATSTISQLSQNGNVTLVRDHFFLSLPKTK